MAFKNKLKNSSFYFPQTKFLKVLKKNEPHFYSENWYYEAGDGGLNLTGGEVVFSHESFLLDKYTRQYCAKANSSKLPIKSTGAHLTFFQRISSSNICDLAGKKVTLSWTASASSINGNLAQHIYIGFPSEKDDWSLASYILINSSVIERIEKRFSITFTLPDECINGAAIYLRLINLGDEAKSVEFKVHSVQLEEGELATNFEQFNKVWIIGASNFALDIALRVVKSIDDCIFAGFIDSRKDYLESAEHKLLEFNIMADYLDPDNFDFGIENYKFIFGFSDPIYKEFFFNKYKITKEKIYRFEQNPDIHYSAMTENGQYWGCTISALTIVGFANFIDSNSIIGHSVTIGNFCHIGVGVIIGGDTFINDSCIIHSGAIIGNKVKIGKCCTIGAGAVVLRDLPDNTKVIAPKCISI